MWRPTMSLLCLVAALSGSPLRQAEAAGDLARSMAELCGGDVIETIDGGVGDDAGDTIPTLRVRAPGDRRFIVPAIDQVAFWVRFPLAVPSPGEDARLPHCAGRRAAGPAPRRAWLQTFRF